MNLALYALLMIAHVEQRNFEWRTPLQGSDREVVLMDAKEFGVCPEAARANYQLAQAHKQWVRDEVVANNKLWQVCQWEQECHWRYRCWDLLDDVLNCRYDAAEKLRRLYQLRDLLGDDAYYARRMPNPTPSYRMGVKP